MTFEELYERAKSVMYPRKLTGYSEAGAVGAAILTAGGKVYSGVCIETACGMGFCAEHAAAAAMVTAGESLVRKMVAVGSDGRILPPCGRCREFLFQIDRGNLETEIVLSGERMATLAELLPERWQELR
jgi:cytidine deaminase